MFKVRHRGNFNNTERFLRKMVRNNFDHYVQEIAEAGVTALAAATPVDSGETAAAWVYDITTDGKSTTIAWSNNNLIVTGTPVVILLRYGHMTGTGGYVSGYEFIDPSIQPIFDEFINRIWNEVTSA